MENSNDKLESEKLENNNLENKPVFSLDLSKLVLPGSIVLAAVLISGTLLFTSYRGNSASQLGLVGDNKGATQKKIEVSVDDDPALGNKNALVTMIEFSDFQCPFCRSFWNETLPLIKSKYIDTGKVRFVYRDFPLSFHESAHVAAEAAECAEDQGKFWTMHDKIFSEQKKLGQGTIQFSVADIKKWGVESGLNPVSFGQCLDFGKYRAEVDKDLADGTVAGVSGTPAFFINGRLVVGAQPFSAFQAVIDEALKN